MNTPAFRLLLGFFAGVSATVTCTAWDYDGHRAVNLLAVESLPKSFPDFVRAPAAMERIAFLSGEPDRWRNVSEPPLRHVNAPDHFFDSEDIEKLGLTFEELSDLRLGFVAQVARGRLEHPDRFPERDPEKDRDLTRGSTGYLPWSITENYYKLKSAFSYLKTLEEFGYPEEIQNARENALYYMGLLGHYVGDATQPLHTTNQFNGWKGPNPEHFTTDRKFHQWIDGSFLDRTGGLDLAVLRPREAPAKHLPTGPQADGRDPIFTGTLAFIREQFTKVETVYRLDRDQALSPKSPRKAEGRAFLEGQLLLAGERLGSLWLTAWQDAPVDTYLRASLLKRKMGAKAQADANP